jgi:hypothetical protein
MAAMQLGYMSTYTLIPLLQQFVAGAEWFGKTRQHHPTNHSMTNPRKLTQHNIVPTLHKNGASLIEVADSCITVVAAALQCQLLEWTSGRQAAESALLCWYLLAGIGLQTSQTTPVNITWTYNITP